MKYFFKKNLKKRRYQTGGTGGGCGDNILSKFGREKKKFGSNFSFFPSQFYLPTKTPKQFYSHRTPPLQVRNREKKKKKKKEL